MMAFFIACNSQSPQEQFEAERSKKLRRLDVEFKQMDRELEQTLKYNDFRTHLQINLAKQGIKGEEAQRQLDSISLHDYFNGAPPQWYLDMKKN